MMNISTSTHCNPPSESLVRPSIASLPIELLFFIFQHMWNRVDTQRTSLARCSLVCTRWRPVAQELLFTEVVLRHERAAQAFLSIIGKDSRLGRATKVLTIQVARSPSAVLPQLSPITTYSITSRCPLLYQINLEVLNNLFGRDLKRLFHPQTFEKLQALNLYLKPGYNLQSRTTPQDVFQFLNQFRSLSHLRLSGIRELRCPDGLVTPPPPPSYQLFKFSWINHGRSHTASETHFNLLTDWLFSTSSEQLRIFEFEDYDRVAAPEHFRYFMSKYAKRLVSLRGNFPTEALTSPPLHLSETSPELRELVLTETDLQPQGLISIFPIPSLQFLAIANSIYPEDVAVKTNDWLIFLPNIRRITFQTKGNYEPDWMHWRFQVQCGNYVDVNCVRSVADQYNQEDPVSSLDFPRGRTIENLRRMIIS